MERMVVDGEHFEVSGRSGEPGVYDLRWTSGPDENYGFTTSTVGGEDELEAELERAARSFLSQVDLTTGHIE